MSALGSGAQLAWGSVGTNPSQAEAVELRVPHSSSINLSGRLCVKQTLRPHQAAETELTSHQLPRMFGCMRV